MTNKSNNLNYNISGMKEGCFRREIHEICDFWPSSSPAHTLKSRFFDIWTSGRPLWMTRRISKWTPAHCVSLISSSIPNNKSWTVKVRDSIKSGIHMPENTFVFVYLSTGTSIIVSGHVGTKSIFICRLLANEGKTTVEWKMF